MLAVWQWRYRPSSDDPVELPLALSKLDSISAGKTLAIGFSLSTFNPKNLLLTFAGAASIDASMATPTQQAIALFVYATVASLSVGIPIMGHILSTERFQATLVDWRDWLIRNNTSVVIALLIVFGALIIGNGLKVLSVRSPKTLVQSLSLYEPVFNPELGRKTLHKFHIQIDVWKARNFNRTAEIKTLRKFNLLAIQA